jgi:hypothetical protein
MSYHKFKAFKPHTTQCAVRFGIEECQSTNSLIQSIIKNSYYHRNTYCSVLWYDMICLLTAIGLTPGGSCTVHIYTQTILRTTQNKEYVEQHKNYCNN